jgi:hypothetical protein
LVLAAKNEVTLAERPDREVVSEIAFIVPIHRSSRSEIRPFAIASSARQSRPTGRVADVPVGVAIVAPRSTGVRGKTGWPQIQLFPEIY